MKGEANLSVLLKSLNPKLHEDIYVYCILPHREFQSELNNRTNPFEECFAVIIETEKATLILKRKLAELRGYSYDFPCKRITLKVHSSLNAVGLIAKIATNLANAGIPVNPISAFYHDHLLIPEKKAEAAMGILKKLSKDMKD